MNTNFNEAREYVIEAREALKRRDVEAARELAEQAALLAPDMEEAWLLLAASDPNREEALAYAQKALELNPESPRARGAVDWALGRLKHAQALQSPSESVVSQPVPAAPTAAPAPLPERRRPTWLLPAFVGIGGCVVVGLLAFFALTSPVFASIVNSVAAPAPTQENLWAQVDVPRPDGAPVNDVAAAPQQADTSTPVPTQPEPVVTRTAQPTPSPTSVPTEAPTLVPASPTPAVTETPGSMSMEIVEDTPTSEYVPPAAPSRPQVAGTGNGVRWIDVDLTNQRVYAYEGDTVVNSFIVSTGTWMTPTVTGEYKIYVKYKAADMRGPGYHLADVPYVMYFYKGYGLHGTYWHSNFGTPMSHGCVNLTIPDAGWLYEFASVGTVVNVHY